ncbi:MAG: hypothetical protein DHS20C21_21670 [Gemmatimonadota bacterium]|nr:MAG: hypothetical protein DHS20C21_21670 [Gemmatimonadota bacterium]
MARSGFKGNHNQGVRTVTDSGERNAEPRGSGRKASIVTDACPDSQGLGTS